jgi:UPF0755 protein
MWVRWLTLALLVALGVLGAIWYGHALLQQPLQVPEESQILEVHRGDSLQRVLRRLEDDAVLESPRMVARVARISGRDLAIKTGEYALQPGMTASSLIDLLVEGRTVQYAMTIVEGWTFRQLRRAIAADPVLTATLVGHSDEEVMAALGRPGLHPEGLFLPDTYFFPRGTSDLAFLRRAMLQMDAVLEAAWEGRDGGLPYTDPYEALILASVIEREAKVGSERRTIAGVFVRRLQRGMRLQTDPTVMYGVSPDFNDRLRTRHLRADTPYNTYTRHGLPPTPIAMPGPDSIAAAMHPEPGDALYFVARGDGSHQFSATLEEHNRAVARYQLGSSEDGN